MNTNKTKTILFDIHILSTFFFKPILMSKNRSIHSFSSENKNMLSQNIYMIFTDEYIIYLPISLHPIYMISNHIKNNTNATNNAFYKFLHKALEFKQPYNKHDTSEIQSFIKNMTFPRDDSIFTDIDSTSQELEMRYVNLFFDDEKINRSTGVLCCKTILNIFDVNKSFELLSFTNPYVEYSNNILKLVLKYESYGTIKIVRVVSDETLSSDNIAQVEQIISILCDKHNCNLLKTKFYEF